MLKNKLNIYLRIMEACLYLFTGISPQSVATKLIKNTAKISVFDETAESVRLVQYCRCTYIALNEIDIS